MKLKMIQLIKAVKPMLLDLGFTYFPHKRSWSGGVFCKKEPNSMYLTIGMNIHRFYDFSFTMDLYYSRVTWIGATYGDIPFECSIRPCELLSAEERLTLSLPAEPMDLWWNSIDQNTLIAIKKAIAISEKKLLTNKTLTERVKNSVDIKELLNIGQEIIEKAVNNEPNKDIKYQFVPEKETNSIPVKWFQAAEIVCKKYYDKINKNCVYWSAGDAYRIYTLSKSYRGV